MELIREEQRRLMEQSLTAAVSAAKTAGVGKDELADLIVLLYDETDG